jgi:predicted nucleic acid-binding protein
LASGRRPRLAKAAPRGMATAGEGPVRVRFLLDSVILIDHFNGIPASTKWLTENGGSCSLSVITRAEVLAGFAPPQWPAAKDLLDHFPALPVTVEIADLAASLRRSERWKLPDALQAAVSIHHSLVLVTRNSRDFRGVEDLEVLTPYRL